MAAREGKEIWNGFLQVVKKRKGVFVREEDFFLQQYFWRLQQTDERLEFSMYSSLSATQQTPIGKLPVAWCTLDVKMPPKLQMQLLVDPADVVLGIISGEGLKILCATNVLQRNQLYKTICAALEKPPPNIDNVPPKVKVGTLPSTNVNRSAASSTSTTSWDQDEELDKYGYLILTSELQELGLYDFPCPPLPPRPDCLKSPVPPPRVNMKPTSFPCPEEDYVNRSMGRSAKESETHVYDDVVVGEPSCDKSKDHPKACESPLHDESMGEYVSMYYGDQFDMRMKTIKVRREILQKPSFRLVNHGDDACIAYYNEDAFHGIDLHLGDVVTGVNMLQATSTKGFHKLLMRCLEDEVTIQVRRCLYGEMSHVVLPREGDFESLGLVFGNQHRFYEVTEITNGLVRESGKPHRPKANGVVNAGKFVNWALVEINGKPLPLYESRTDLMIIPKILASSGKDLALLFLPIDLIEMFLSGDCYENFGGDDQWSEDEEEEEEKEEEEEVTYAEIYD